jgi:hypothetical protein
VVAPIQLTNGCDESHLRVESDDVRLTNFLRRHYLERFGHRDLSGVIHDYANDAIIIHSVTSHDNRSGLGGDQQRHTKKTFRGKAEILLYYRDLILPIHEEGAEGDSSSFRLESIEINNGNAVVRWSAKTPTLSIVDGCDRYTITEGVGEQFHITKQFCSCETHDRETILKLERRRTLSLSEASSSSDHSSSMLL